MRKLGIAFLYLLLAAGALAAQNTNTRASKKSAAPKAPAADCSKTDDATITANVRDRLSKTVSLKDFTINVAASAGLVTLTGSVRTGLNKGLATLQAKRVPCVKKVDNRLTVEQKSAPARRKTANKNAKM